METNVGSRLKQSALRLVIPVLLLGASLWGFESGDIDISIQDWIYDSGALAWPISKADHGLRLIFYDGPKVGLIAFGVGLFLALPWSFRDARLARYRRQMTFILVVLALVPSIASLGKAVSNVYCPSKLERYGGKAPYVRLFAPYPDGFVQQKRGRCFPAGHASGGFALIALFYVLNRRAWRISGLVLGLSVGWLMGGYQMVIGSHFLSDTVVTMFLAWIVCVLFDPLILRKPATENRQPDHTDAAKS